MHLIRQGIRSIRLRSIMAALGFVAISAGAAAAQGTISGRVTTGAAQPLPDSRVLVVGTTITTTTNGEGRFTLRGVPAGSAEVRVIRVGYQEQKKPVTVTNGGAETLDFTLDPNVARLTEVVITATGEQRKAEIGNSVTTIDAATRVQETPIHNMGDLLAAKAPGVAVIPGSMTGQAAQVHIRGLNSLSRSNAPIYIIDGVRMDGGTGGLSVGGTQSSRLNDITPEEIDHLEIVKGPSAATLYGTDAANGVIIIQTKRGRAGNTRYTYTAEGGRITDPNHYWDTYAIWGHTPTAPATQTRCILSTMAAGTCIKDSVTSANIMLNEKTSPIGTGNRSLYGMQVSGGTEAVRFFVSGNLENEIGPIRLPARDYNYLVSQLVTPRGEWKNPEALQRESFRVNMNAALSPKLDLTLNSAFIKSDQRLPQVDNNVNSFYYNAYTNPGFTQAYACSSPCSGLTYNPIGNLGQPLDGWAAYTPGEIFQTTRLEGVQRMLGSFTASYRPLSWLQNDVTTGIDLQATDNFSLCRLNECANFSTNRQGSVTDTHASQRIFTSQVRSAATWVPRSFMTLTGTIGGDYNNNENEQSRAASSILSPGGQTVGSGAVKDASNTQPTATKTLGYFAQGQVALRDRLFITAALRGDQNTAFGTQYKRVVYPSAQVAWTVSDETFFPQFSFLNELRLRSAYGSSGVQPGATQALQTFNASTVSLSSDQPALLASAIGNPKLKPETTTEFEAGFDSRWLTNRVNFEFTFYRKQSKDALINQSIASSAAASSGSVLRNLGKVRNTGVEASVNAQILDLPTFGWDMTVGGSHNKNTLITLGVDDGGKKIPTIGTTVRQQEGFPLNAFFLQSYSFADSNKDGLIGVNEVILGDTGKYIGQGLPTELVSIQSGFDFLKKKLRVIASLDYRGGHTLFNQGGNFLCGQTNACPAKSLPGTPIWDQARNVAANYTATKTQVGYYENGQSWRLRELSAVVTLPDQWASRIRAQNANLQLGARNLKVWTAYTGQDPEANYSTGDGQTDFLTTSPRRYFTARINLRY